MAAVKSRAEAVKRITESSLHSGRNADRRIRYAPLPSQRRFHDIRSRHKGFSGPVGSGKSLALVYEALRLSLKNQGLLGLIGAPTYPMLRDVTQRAVFEFLEKSAVPFSFQKQENLLTFKDFGSEIIFRSLDNPETQRGTNLSWYGVDELTYTQEASFLRLQARLRHPLASELCGFGVWTPNGYDWVYKRFIGPEKRPDYQVVLATPRENKYLPGGFYDNLAQSYDPRFYEQEVLGEYLPQSGNRVYYAFDRKVSVQQNEYRPGAALYWSLDFNVDPMCSVIAIEEDLTTRIEMLQGQRNRNLRVIDEICMRNSNVDEVCREFIARTEKWNRYGALVVNVYGDPAGNARSHAGPSDWSLVFEHFKNRRDYQLVRRVASSAPRIKDRVNSVNAMLLNHAGQRRLTIDPRCKELTADLEQVSWRQDMAGNVGNDLDKRDPLRSHATDALGYLVFGEFPIRQGVKSQTEQIYGLA